MEASKFQDLQSRLLEQFDGLTYFPQPNKGFWKFGDISYQDEIVIYRVISENPGSARDFLVKLKAWLRDQFKQKEILIIEREVGVL